MAPSPAQTYTDPINLGGSGGNDDDPDNMVPNLCTSLLLHHVCCPPAPPQDDAPLPNGTIVKGLHVLLQAQHLFRAWQQTLPAAGRGDDEA